MPDHQINNLNLRCVVEWIWSLARGWPARLICWGLLGISVLYFLLFALLLVRGTHWAYILYAENPYAHFFGGMFFLAAWHFLRKGYRESPVIWAGRLGKFVLMLFSLTLSFFAGEIGLRLLLHSRQQANSLEALKNLAHERSQQPIRSTHPLGAIIQPSLWDKLVYELQPNLNTNFGGKSLRTNQAGMRESNEYAIERRPRSVRILGIGDSGMFGWNVDQDQDYLTVLEHQLNARGDDVTYEVLNMAVPGYNTQLETETLQLKGLAYQPDIVIIGWCENDGQLPFFLLEKEDFSRRDVSFLHMLVFRRDDFREIATGTKLRDLRDAQRKQISPEILSGTETEGLRAAFTDLKKLSDEHGFHLLVFGPMGRSVRELVHSIGIPYYNTREKVDAKQYPADWKVHFMHPTADGHRILGEHLTEEIMRRNWLQPPEERN